MPIQISGSGNISGINTGGLNDGCIDTGDLATGAVTAAKLSTGAAGTGVGFIYDSGSNYIIFKTFVDTKFAVCWGTGTTSATAFVSVTFPVTFSSTPYFNCADTNRTAFNTTIILTHFGNLTTTGADIINVTDSGTPVNNARTFNWFAFGPVA